MKAQRIESDGRGDQIMPMTKPCLWCFQVSVFAKSSRILDILCILEACLQSVWPNLVSSNMDDNFFSVFHIADIGAYGWEGRQGHYLPKVLFEYLRNAHITSFNSRST